MLMPGDVFFYHVVEPMTEADFAWLLYISQA
jgi:hypothetical protein